MCSNCALTLVAPGCARVRGDLTARWPGACLCVSAPRVPNTGSPWTWSSSWLLSASLGDCAGPQEGDRGHAELICPIGHRSPGRSKPRSRGRWLREPQKLGSLGVGMALPNRLLPPSGATSWGARHSFRVGTPEPHHSGRGPLRIRFQEKGSAVCRPHKVIASSPELVCPDL